MIAGLILGILLVAQAAPSARDENWRAARMPTPIPASRPARP